jgi:hypothetical protein
MTSSTMTGSPSWARAIEGDTNVATATSNAATINFDFTKNLLLL